MKAPEYRDQLDLFTGEPAAPGVTVGTVTHGGITYEVDWPYEIDDETVRDDCAFLYQGGRFVAEFINQDWQPDGGHDGFSSAEEVLVHAQRFLATGGAK